MKAGGSDSSHGGSGVCVCVSWGQFLGVGRSWLSHSRWNLQDRMVSAANDRSESGSLTKLCFTEGTSTFELGGATASCRRHTHARAA